MTNGPTVLERRLVFCLDGGDDSVLELQVRHKLDRSRCLPGEDGGPDVEISTAMGGDKLSFRAWYPLDTCHPCLVNGTLQRRYIRMYIWLTSLQTHSMKLSCCTNMCFFTDSCLS